VLTRLRRHAHARVVPLGDLARLAGQAGYADVVADGAWPFLRAYHVRHADLDVYMLFNEHPYESVDTTMTVPGAGPAYAYDAFRNARSACESVVRGDCLRFPVRLSPYESIVMITGPGAGDAPREHLIPLDGRRLRVEGPWNVSVSTAEDYPGFRAWRSVDGLVDMSHPERLPSFSGTFRYEADFTWDGRTRSAVLDLGEAFETAEVWLNGHPLGVRLCPPYRFAIALSGGKNRLVVEVTNTLGPSQRDYFSRFAHQEPSGLMGPVEIICRPS
jgi:hypothetical protein